MGILADIKHLVVTPALNAVGLGGATAINLVTGSGSVESSYQYLKQIGSGPALGFWEMEPITHDYLWTLPSMKAAHTDSGSLGARILAASGAICMPDELVWNLYYAALMCRVKYLSVSDPLPANNAAALAAYWKRIYNSNLGAGIVDAAHVAAFQAAIDA